MYFSALKYFNVIASICYVGPIINNGQNQNPLVFLPKRFIIDPKNCLIRKLKTYHIRQLAHCINITKQGLKQRGLRPLNLGWSSSDIQQWAAEMENLPTFIRVKKDARLAAWTHLQNWFNHHYRRASISAEAGSTVV